MTWTAKDVKFELVKAFRVLSVVPVRDPDPRAGSFWPKIYHDRDELKEQAKQATTENRPIRSRHNFSPRDIKRMESVLLGEGSRKGWLAEYLQDHPGAKRCLTRWAIWTAQDRNLKHELFIRGLAYSTFRRKRDQAAQLLADALNAERVELV
jgi:hypothetical protein